MSWRRFLGPRYAYDEATQALGGDLLQSSGWGELKATLGWRAQRFLHTERGGVDASAQVLLRRVGPGIQIGYLPRGPTGLLGAEAWREFAEFARREGAREGSLIWRIDPDAPSELLSEEDLLGAGFRRLPARGRFGGIQPRLVFRRALGGGLPHTGELGRRLRRALATGSEARREGSEAMEDVGRLLRDTAKRQGLRPRSMSYYQALHRLLSENGCAELFMVRQARQAIAAAIIGRFGGRATYLLGASATWARHLLPGYHVQAEVIAWAEREGLHTYDLRGGVVDDPTHGLNRFKRLFGEEVRLMGERDLPLRLDYWIWRQLEPLRAAWISRQGRPALD